MNTDLAELQTPIDGASTELNRSLRRFARRRSPGSRRRGVETQGGTVIHSRMMSPLSMQLIAAQFRWHLADQERVCNCRGDRPNRRLFQGLLPGPACLA
jgi:hypothetical protein